MGKIMDKDSTIYFMTKMTQKEFDERRGGHQIKKDYEFNRIQPEHNKREDLDNKLIYKEPNVDEMTPTMRSKYVSVKEILKCNALNLISTSRD